MEFLRICLEDLRGVPARIDADRIEEHVLADPISQEPLHLRELGGLQRTARAAVGVDEVDGDRFPLEQIVVETDDLPLVRGQRDVGEVVRPPAVARGHGSGAAEDGRRAAQHGGKRRDPGPSRRSHASSPAVSSVGPARRWSQPRP